MTFQSFEYAALLLLVLAVYWLLPRRLQNILLLAASYVFYAWVDPRMALLLFGYTVVNYTVVLGIDRAQTSNGDSQNARRYLIVSIVASLGTLVFFKYAGFFFGNVSDALGAIGLADFDSTLKIILPVGISFYTFQSLGYVIDVYTKRTSARHDFVDTALFISFFPQLVAGPIERANDLLPQIERLRRLNPDHLSSGVSLLAWGFFKKLVIADNVGMIVDDIFSTPDPGAATLWVGTFAFGIQILADFSGYTDIARGSARLLGINLSSNFRHPWFASSPADFWRRWHITFSTWLRDYVYIPLGGNRRGNRRTVINIFIVFAIGGLWHGAAWNFVVWSLFHACLILAWQAAHRFNSGIYRPAAAITPLLATLLIWTSWVLFREGDLRFIGDNIFRQGLDTQLAFTLGTTALLYSIPLWLHAFVDRPGVANIWTRNDVSRTVASTAIALTSFIGILFLRADLSAEFIYFRF